ncbi:M20/M25/M40 family metallo-hydrolase [Flavihumibacter rivuli]|uniref:M20/M25/M40 family metallo-hydrolase n=1 Tax=Flavihumibacter rivuli TaxID=2838156 RepID=UPI001BDF58EF|nr:M20/M25/M40 family metallo-hydrolase [Flavihumibacter rivuli]ULQ56826.1 M20/M25/M40 family metallo-hydrolase [Flavihumibacter rivuli]
MNRIKGKTLVTAILLTLGLNARAQHEEMIRKIYAEQLNHSEAYTNLGFLCKKIGNRITGSPQAAKAVSYTRELMEQYGFDTVYLQPMKVGFWTRNGKEKVTMKVEGKPAIQLNALALANTLGTGPGGVEAEVLEIAHIRELEKLGEAAVKGKIIFINGKFNQELINPMQAYVEVGSQRSYGPHEAAKLGAAGVVIRSLSINQDDQPHTGYTFVDPKGRTVPGLALSTNDADRLELALKGNKKVKLHLQYSAGVKDSVTTYNVIGEIRGSSDPNTIIAVGGHLDSWDVGEGAHDDGGGCMQAIEVGRTFRKLGIRPRHTLRVILFMDEENNGTGSITYANAVKQRKERHLAALESDLGVFTPAGFSFDNDDPKVWEKIRSWAKYFEPYNLYHFKKGFSGEDIAILKENTGLLIGFQPDPQRYMKYHHTHWDTFEAVDRRELVLGAAAITALLYIIDQDGL